MAANIDQTQTKYAISPSKQIAWITGAGSGIGKALALRLAQDGWTVAVSARSVADLEALAAQQPERIHIFPLDVTDPSATYDVVERIESRLGPLALAVLNAGTYSRDSASRFEAEAFRKMVDVNLMGTVNCLSIVMAKMIGRKSGHIAVVSSVSGYVGLPGAAGYGATKAALINMCAALYPELEAQNVRLSLINPGFVDTPLTRKNDFPMPFLISVEDAVDAITKGLKSSRYEIAFPWKMVLSMKLLAALPARLRFAITRRMVRQ